MQDSEGLKFILLKEGKDTGITFRAVPGGHEFTSLLMAVLNADGKGKNFPDEFITRRIKALQGPISLTTYLSLTCTNCPDVVQALNMMVLLNGQIRHEAVDGSINEEEVERMKYRPFLLYLLMVNRFMWGVAVWGICWRSWKPVTVRWNWKLLKQKNMMYW